MSNSKKIVVGLFVGWIVFSLPIFTQEEMVIADTNFHNPKTAAKLSIFLPGAGQIYNHRAMPKGKKNAWWKIPIIYAGLGFTGYEVVANHVLQRDLRNEFVFRTENGFPNPDFPEFQQFDNQGVLQLYQQFKLSRDLMIFAFVAVYGLNVLDAFVEGHFVDFDISKDLSMQLQPVYMQHNQAAGLRVTLRFNSRK
ncbi:MAG: hypothetical protein JJT77_12660 [Crocinitomicaceae bacterium]|nr:hypothetical protein [Crocinitomicaceae bacterium]